jgi:hypothetical protein
MYKYTSELRADELGIEITVKMLFNYTVIGIGI